MRKRWAGETTPDALSGALDSLEGHSAYRLLAQLLTGGNADPVPYALCA